MTLVIGQMTPWWVLIAADRVLSRSGRVVKKDAIKVVVYYNDMAFGYTGIAQVLGERGRPIETGQWMVNTLQEVGKRSIITAVESLAEQAERMVAAIARTRKRPPLAIMGVGWDTTLDGADKSDPAPVSCIISNFSDPSQPKKQFCAKIEKEVRESNACAMHAVGTTRKEDIQWIADTVAAKDPCDVFSIAQVVKEGIRRTSRREPESVGEDVVGVIIPRGAAMSQDVTVYGPGCKGGVFFTNEDKPRDRNLDTSSYFFSFQKGDVERYESPHVVAPGFTHCGALLRSDCDGRMEAGITVTSKLEVGALTALLSAPSAATQRRKRK